MPTLNWIGKEAVIKHHKEVPFRLLEPVAELSCSPLLQEGEGSSYGETHRPRRQPARAESPAAALCGQGQVHLYRPAIQHRQRRVGLQQQRQQRGNQEVAGQGRRDAGQA